MEENEIMQPAESAPQEDTESAATAAAEPTEQSDAVTDTIPEAEAGESVQQPITIPIQYNHESRELTLEEAQKLAQKGLKFDEVSPTLEKIRFLAAANGKSMQEMVDALAESQDKQLYQSILAECDGNESIAQRLFDAEKLKRQTAAESAQKEAAAAQEKEKADLAKRLADEFVELQQEFPELAEFSAVPKAVLDAAVKGKNLTDAYLRYQRAESKKVSAAKATQEQAAKASAGSQAEGAGETTNPTIDAMLAGVWAR